MGKKKKKRDKMLTALQIRAKLARRDADLIRAQSHIAQLERLLQNGDALRRIGEHWYELVEYFDPEQIQRIQLKDYDGEPVFAMGLLSDAIVLEIPETAGASEMAQFVDTIRERRIASPILFIRAGVRFLKLATVNPALEAQLDAKERQKNEEKSKARAAASFDIVGLGPVPAGNGLGDRVPSDGADPSGGCDSHEAAVEAGEEATNHV